MKRDDPHRLMPEHPTEAESRLSTPTLRPLGEVLRSRNRLIVAAASAVLLLAVGYSVWTGPRTGLVSLDRPSSTDGIASQIKSDPGAALPDHSAPATIPASTNEAPIPFSKSPLYASALSVAGMEDDGNRAEAIEALMETWVAANPQQAADWAGSLPSGTFRDDTLSALMVHWAARAPGDAAAWMSRTGVDDGEASSILAGSWAATNPAAATAWAATLGNLESRRMATSSALSAWANTAPQAAAAFAERLPANDRAAAITAVVSTWAATAPSEAAGWLARIPFESSSDHALALATLITPWSSQNPGAASKFINTLPEGPPREAAASQFAVTAAATAPAEALMWAMNLKDPDQRNQVVADACESWYDKSPESFRAGIAEAIALMEDPAMRRSVYEMLYERDPDFQTNLLHLADQPATDHAIAPPAPTTPPTEELSAPDASLLPPPAPDEPAADR